MDSNIEDENKQEIFSNTIKNLFQLKENAYISIEKAILTSTHSAELTLSINFYNKDKELLFKELSKIINLKTEIEREIKFRWEIELSKRPTQEPETEDDLQFKKDILEIKNENAKQ